jgi:hypothetical protein
VLVDRYLRTNPIDKYVQYGVYYLYRINGNRTCYGCSNNMLWMSMTFRVWFECGDLVCHGRSSLVGRYVCIDGFKSFGHDLNHEVISKILIGIRVVIWENLLLKERIH